MINKLFYFFLSGNNSMHYDSHQNINFSCKQRHISILFENGNDSNNRDQDCMYSFTNHV